MTHAEEFAQRLHTVLRAQHPNKAQAITWLAQTCGCSVQMARRYWSGTALPKPAAILTLAQQLHVRASWLYFDEGQPHVPRGYITLHPEVLTYLLHALLPALASQKTGDSWADSLCNLLENLPVSTPEYVKVLQALQPLI